MTPKEMLEMLADVSRRLKAADDLFPTTNVAIDFAESTGALITAVDRLLEVVAALVEKEAQK